MENLGGYVKRFSGRARRKITEMVAKSAANIVQHPVAQHSLYSTPGIERVSISR